MTSSARPRTALIWERFGPYHHARMEAASRRLDLHGIEVVARDETYAWQETAALPGYAMHLLDGRPMSEVLDWIAPEVVAVPGWEAGYALAAIAWARRASARVVMMSDSNAHDAPRVRIKEWFKRGVVAEAQAGLSAGTTARAYLANLGMDPSRVTQGYDVVDNAHFARPPGTPPRPGFIAVARFVEKKNLAVLISAYAIYRAEAGPDPWSLVLVGDGPLRPALEAQVAALGLTGAVTLPGFVQYPDLPALYHGAGTLVMPSVVEPWGLVVNEAMAAGVPALVSKVAGCARDLVVEGETGFTFAPNDVKGFAQAMGALAANPGRTAKMGTKAAAHIAGWNLAAFAEGLERAVDMALAAPAAQQPSFRLWVLQQRGRA